MSDTENNNKEIEILTSKKEELTNLLNSSKSTILSQALNQELKNISGKLEILKNKKKNNVKSQNFIDVYDNLDKNYLSKNTDYDLSQVTSFEPSKLKEIKDKNKSVKPIQIIRKDNTDIEDAGLLKIYNKYVKKNSSSESKKNMSNDFRTEFLLNCKEIISIVKILERKDKNNKLIIKLKTSTRKLAESIDKQFR
jgi:hypothetical protein